MAATLSNCTIEEQCAVVHFLCAEGVKSAEIYRRMLAQYGARTMHQRKIYEWIERFKEGRTNVTDESRPWSPIDITHGPTHPEGGCLDQRRLTTHVSMCNRLGSHGDVQQAVQTWLREQLKSFFFKGIKKLTEQYQRRITVQGDYVKK
jgi:tRNA-dihydrouridine synthase